MSERRFEQSMNPREHIEQESKDAGINSPSEWRKATEIESEVEGLEARIRACMQFFGTRLSAMSAQFLGENAA